MPDSWYWCLTHSKVEGGESTCPPDDRMGPYQSREAAENWKDTVESRNDTWDKEDSEWSGEEE